MKILTILLILSSALDINASSTKKKVDELHERARQLQHTHLDSVMILADSSLILAKKKGYQFGIAKSYYIKGVVYRKQKNLSKAFLMYLKASVILDKLQDEKSVKTYLDVLLGSGAILVRYYKYDEAIELYNKGLELASKKSFEIRKQKLLYNKSYAFWKKGNLPNALDNLKETVQLAYKLGDSSRVLKCFNLFGLINKDNQFHETAREYYEYILASPRASDRDKAAAYHNIAVTFNEENQLDISKEYFDKALVLKRTINDSQFLFNTLHNLAERHLKNDEIQKSLTYALECENIYPSLFAQPETFGIFTLLYRINYNSNAFKKANIHAEIYFEESQSFIEYQDDIMRQLKSFQMDLIMAGFELEQRAEKQKATFYLIIKILSGLIGICLLIIGYLRYRKYRTRIEIENGLIDLKIIDSDTRNYSGL